MIKIIEAIEEKLKSQEDAITLQKWQISDLTAKLEEAKKIERLKGEKNETL